MNNNLKKFIKKNIDDIIITGGISNKRIFEVENKLKAKLTKEYKNYLKYYGVIMGYGVEFLGCGKSKNSSVVSETLRYRNFGLEKHFIVIRNADEWIYCLDLLTSKVSSWDRSNKVHKLISNDFNEYLLLTLKEAKENW